MGAVRARREDEEGAGLGLGEEGGGASSEEGGGCSKKVRGAGWRDSSSWVCLGVGE